MFERISRQPAPANTRQVTLPQRQGHQHATLTGLQRRADTSQATQQLMRFQNAAGMVQFKWSAYTPVVQQVGGGQQQNPVSHRHARNMQASLARVFRTRPGRWQIDRTTGRTFPDNNREGTTGHHGVRVTDAQTGQVYYCDFHQDGRYYTRG